MRCFWKSEQTEMEPTIVQTSLNWKGDQSEKRKARKIKKSISNSTPDEDICLQKKSSLEGGLSQSPASDAISDAEVAQSQRKENDKAYSTRTDDTNAVGNNDISCASEYRHSDIVCQSLKTKAASSTICNQNQDHEAKKLKKLKKRKRFMSNADCNCEANDCSSQEKSLHGGDLSLSAATVMCNQADGIVSDHFNVASQDTETAPSTICNQNKKLKEKKRMRQNKSTDAILNPDSNCDPDGIFSQKRSYSGGDMSLPSVASTNIQADAKDSQIQLDENDNTHSSHLVREAINGIVSDHTTKAVTQSIETAPSTVCDQSKELKAKKRKKPKKSKKIHHAINNADSNCDPDGIFSQKRSCSGGDVALQSAGSADIQSDAKDSRIQLKENDNAQSSHLDRKAIIVTVSDHINKAVTQSVEIAPSTRCDQNKELKTKKRNKRKKSKKNDDAIINAEINCDPDGICSQKASCFGEDVSLSFTGGSHTQADLEVSQLHLKKKVKSGSSHVDGGTTNCILSDNSINLISQTIETAPLTVCDQNKELKAKKSKKRKKSKKINDSILNADSNCTPDGVSSWDNFSSVPPRLLDQSDINSELSNVRLPSLAVKAAGQSGRKLLILDLNGLLADIRRGHVKRCKPDGVVSGKSVYKRPFCEDFLDFCFQNFDVAVWSSRKWHATMSISEFLTKDNMKKLIFCWCQYQCRKNKYKTIGDEPKPIFMKELQMVWEKEGKKGLEIPGKKGLYNEWNTLLIDDSPYKALRNPPYTGIFPHPYVFPNLEDNSLGPNGELRLYLERLAAAENVPDFVKENPIGQTPITDGHPSWDYYSKVKDFSSDVNPRKKVKNSVPKSVVQQKGGLITRPQAKKQGNEVMESVPESVVQPERGLRRGPYWITVSKSVVPQQGGLITRPQAKKQENKVVESVPESVVQPERGLRRGPYWTSVLKSVVPQEAGLITRPQATKQGNKVVESVPESVVQPE